MLLAFLIFEALALLCFVLFWLAASGRHRQWLAHRGRWGFTPLGTAATGMFFQSLAILVPAYPMNEAEPLYDLLMGLGVACLFLGVPVLIYGANFPVPGFVLPGWFTEHLRAEESGELTQTMPADAEPAGPARWWAGAVLCLGMGALGIVLFISWLINAATFSNVLGQGLAVLSGPAGLGLVIAGAWLGREGLKLTKQQT